MLVHYAGAPDESALEGWALKHPLRLAFDDIVPVASIPRTEMGKVEHRARDITQAQIQTRTIN